MHSKDQRGWNEGHSSLNPYESDFIYSIGLLIGIFKVGLAIKPKTKVEDLLPFINDIDMALIMTVEPGRG